MKELSRISATAPIQAAKYGQYRELFYNYSIYDICEFHLIVSEIKE